MNLKLVNKRKCRKCVYRTKIHTSIACGYLLYTGKARIKLNDAPGQCSVYLPQRGNLKLRRKLLHNKPKF